MESIDNFSQMQEAATSVKALVEASFAANTRRAYSSRLRMFSDWCAAAGTLHHPPVPSGILARYIAAMVDAGKAISTIEQSLAVISFIHRLRGCKDPTKHELIRRTLRGAKRTVGTAPIKKRRCGSLC